MFSMQFLKGTEKSSISISHFTHWFATQGSEKNCLKLWLYAFAINQNLDYFLIKIRIQSVKIDGECKPSMVYAQTPNCKPKIHFRPVKQVAVHTPFIFQEGWISIRALDIHLPPKCHQWHCRCTQMAWHLQWIRPSPVMIILLSA